MHECDLVRLASPLICAMYPGMDSLFEVAYGRQYRIDQVLYKPRRIIAIEYKMRDWRFAISQAQHHKYHADECFILLPQKACTIKAIQCCVDSEIGLFSYSHRQVKMLVKPVSRSIKAFRDNMERRIIKIQYHLP